MTVSSGFFNSVNHDRLYDAEQLSSIFDGIILDGVYENVGSAFEVSSNPDANDSIFVRTGRAWFDHTWTLNDSNMVMTLEPPNEMLTRIDAVVIDVDRRESVRANTIKLVTGTLSSNPQPPVLIKEDLHNQYPLAYITRPAGSSGVVSNSNIENKVGTEECPLVTGILEMVNNDNFWQQLDSEFNEWWDGIKATLDENVATNLQNQIDALDKRIDDVVANGTVGDDGVIGDYQICLTKSQVNSMVNGTTGNTLNASSVSYSANIFGDDDSFISNGGAKPDYTGKSAFILPDGWVAFIYFECMDDFSAGSPYLHVNLISPEGVVTYSYEQLDSKMRNTHYSLTIGKIDASHYPIVVPVLLISSNDMTTKGSGNDTTMRSYDMYGTITITEEHLVNYSLSMSSISQTVTSNYDKISGIVSLMSIVNEDGTRIGIMGFYNTGGVFDGDGNLVRLVKLLNDGTVQHGSSVNPQIDGSFEMTGDDSAEFMYGFNDGSSKYFTFNTTNLDYLDGWQAFTINPDNLTITNRGAKDNPSNYYIGSNGVFNTYNLAQGLKKVETYNGYVNSTQTQESYPCFPLYTRGMTLNNGDTMGTVYVLEDGTEDILLHFSGNANHVHRNPQTSICVIENNLTVSGLNIDKASISKSPNGIRIEDGQTVYVWQGQISSLPQAWGESMLTVGKITIGG